MSPAGEEGSLAGGYAMVSAKRSVFEVELRKSDICRLVIFIRGTIISSLTTAT